jgi:hypothetical protein
MSLQDQEVANKEKYEQLIKDLELEINQLKCAGRTPMLINCNHEEEINQLQVRVYTTACKQITLIFKN